MVLHPPKLDEPILQVKLNRRLVIVDHVEPDGNTLRALAFHNLNRVLEHARAQPQRSALINDADGHDVAGRSLADYLVVAGEHFLEALQPALSIPTWLVNVVE